YWIVIEFLLYKKRLLKAITQACPLYSHSTFDKDFLNISVYYCLLQISQPTFHDRDVWGPHHILIGKYQVIIKTQFTLIYYLLALLLDTHVLVNVLLAILCVLFFVLFSMCIISIFNISIWNDASHIY
ncbi:hypothetical protein ACJX0J_030668, partial [Zea mays]